MKWTLQRLLNVRWQPANGKKNQKKKTDPCSCIQTAYTQREAHPDSISGFHDTFMTNGLTANVLLNVMQHLFSGTNYRTLV